ncbi:Metallo-dependent phosphatase [Tilletiaria anomala UBC 951]|uniref:Metallo-dependent phosphatase n=1 Tax=Tilletiaria anomala (strain ATCC 24038 / CBS 436.72 / UBC 951) TaxID=1037660 RepID=A0A066VHB3_TILAU|nr:Metallo-dependent phosphatase [Tilletiaria anomala UBC 951]KDN38154.1 Metallo-dependent phosphatase [Tilletiaria anomala UBC 951]
MAIRLRDLTSPQRQDGEIYTPVLPRSMRDDDAVQSGRRRRGKFMLCRILGAYVVFFLLLLSTWRHWHEVIPYHSSKEIGWQEFQSIRSSSLAAADGGNVATASFNQDSTQFGPSFPLDKYTPLLPNAVPLTELTIEVCWPMLPCKPPSTASEDVGLGKWVLVKRALNGREAMALGTVNSAEKSNTAPLSGGFFQAGVGAGALWKLNSLFGKRWLFYRRPRIADIGSRIVDVRIVEKGQTPPERKEGWHRVKHDIRSPFMQLFAKGSSAHLYYRTGGSLAALQASRNQTLGLRQWKDANLEPITEIDVIYGPNEPLPGFTRAGEIMPNNEATKSPGALLAVRRKPVSPPELPPYPLFKKDGTFKILQLADLHYSVQHEPCRNVDEHLDWKYSSGKCLGDFETMARVGAWLDAEKPDLVVLSGDQLNGQGTSWDERSVIMKIIQPMIDRKIMWASIMGNHDSESGFLSRRQFQSMLRQMPYSKTIAGPEDIHGSSNFYLHLHAPTPDKTRLATLYFMDTGAKVLKKATILPDIMTGGSKSKEGDGVSVYDYIQQSQILWFQELSRKAKKIIRPYEPDRGKDIDRLWSRSDIMNSFESRLRRATSEPAQTMRKPTGIVFQHIPLPEAFNGTVDKDPHTGHKFIIGERHEKIDIESGQARSGFFDAVLNAASATSTLTASSERDVELIVHGHMHNNEDCRRVQGVWICFGGGSSFAGYGRADLKRRARVIQLDKWGERISTWHRYDDGSKSKVHTLYDMKL